MSTTDRISGKPYSAKAYDAACSADVSGWSPMYVLNATHDREALGLDASARIGDIINEVVEWLREATVDTFCTSLPDDLLREFDAKGTR